MEYHFIIMKFAGRESRRWAAGCSADGLRVLCREVVRTVLQHRAQAAPSLLWGQRALFSLQCSEKFCKIGLVGLRPSASVLFFVSVQIM